MPQQITRLWVSMCVCLCVPICVSWCTCLCVYTDMCKHSKKHTVLDYSKKQPYSKLFLLSWFLCKHFLNCMIRDLKEGKGLHYWSWRCISTVNSLHQGVHTCFILLHHWTPQEPQEEGFLIPTLQVRVLSFTE